MKFNWIGEAFEYGERRSFFCIYSQNVSLKFVISLTSDPDAKYPFFIARTDKNVNTINIEEEVYDDIEEVWLIETDDEFRKKTKRAYNILKIATSREVISIGVYGDDGKILTANSSYLLCTTDFINLLAGATKITEADQLRGTAFEALVCIFDKKELAKELLRNKG